MLSRVCRVTSCVAAGIWLGGLIVIAIVAQTTFAVMRTTGVEQPNALAGKVMARNFARFDVLQGICAAALLAGATALALGGARNLRTASRLLLVLACCGLFAYSALVLTPGITQMQPSLQAVDADGAIKSAFDAFHARAVRVSQAIMLLVLILAVELAWPEGHRPRPATELPHRGLP